MTPTQAPIPDPVNKTVASTQYSGSQPVFNLNQSGMKAASTWKLDPTTQTVAGQLGTIMSSDNPLMQRAKTRALQSQVASGRLNSTMADSAGEAAMYDAAMPIATADASIYGNNAQFNVGEQNKFGLQSNDQNFQGQMANFNVGANEWSANKAQDRTLSRDAIQQGYNLSNIAANNTNQVARDATLHGYSTADINLNNTNQVARDLTLQGYNLSTIAANNANQVTRDSTLHGYNTADINLNNANQTARDSTLHGYNTADINLNNTNQVARDSTLHFYNTADINLNNANQVARDATLATTNKDAAAALAGVQTARDATLHGYGTEDIKLNNLNQVGRDSKLAETNANAATLLNDRNIVNTKTAIDANANAATVLNDRNVTNADTATKKAQDTEAVTTIHKAQSDFAAQIADIARNGTMGLDARRESINALVTNYNTIIKSAAVSRGWDSVSWLVDQVAAKADITAAETRDAAAKNSSGGNRPDTSRGPIP